MAGTAAQIAEDNAAVDAYRRKFGDAEAAKFAADLYKLRRTPAPASSFAGLPRAVILLIAIWIGLLETAEKLPFLLLSYPQYQATLAEIHAKMLQPDLVAAQLEKARFDAKTAAYQPDTAAVQLAKTKFETKAAAYQPDTAEAQLEKSKQEARAAAWQPALTAAQGFAAQMQFLSGVPPDDFRKETNLAIWKERPEAQRLLSESTPPQTPTPEPSPAPAETPTPTPIPLRTPTTFDCGKASMGTDYVICASPELMDAMARLEDAYHAARAAKGDAVKNEEVEWIKHYGPDCGLPLRGKPTDSLIQGTTYCVHSAIEKRIKELQAEE
jgi:hypothetical protein